MLGVKTKTKTLRGGVKRIVHVLAKNLKENLESGTNKPLVAVRPFKNPKKLKLYRHVEILGPSVLLHVSPEEALPDTNGRAICYLITKAALKVHVDTQTEE